MKFHLTYLIIVLIFLNTSCSKEKEKISILEEESLEIQMIKAYNDGLKELDRGDVVLAAKKFNEAELLYPQSIWAPRAALMAAYSYFSKYYFSDAVLELEKFLDKYKNHPRRDYAYYLLALSHYDQIIDEKKDLKEILASKEMYIARYYVEREKWIPAINRFKKVVNDYDETIFIEEALHRLVELHYKVGLIDESKKYAILLGYNYQSSQWYEETYKILNKDYVKISKNKNKDKKESIIKKFKDLLK